MEGEIVVADQPADLIRSRIEGEKALASALAGLVQSKCVVQIQGRPYVTVTGLTAVARGLGLTVLETSCAKNDGEGGYLATAEVHDEGGRVVGRGSGFVAYDESPWRNRPEFARRAMASTRAAGRALRLVLAPVIVGMGYEATSAEEMPREAHEPTKRHVEPVEEEAKQGRSTGLPVIVRRNAGKSKSALLVSVDGVEIWVNEEDSKSMIETAVEKGLEVEVAWSRRGKWVSADREGVSHALPF